MRTTLIPKIELHEKLQSQIMNALPAGIVAAMRSICRGDVGDIRLKSQNEGSSVKIGPNMMNELFEICREVKERLDFEDPIDFYIKQRSEINAYTIASDDLEVRPHIIVIYSALYNLMTKEEIAFVIGHEIGHLINKDCFVKNVCSFVYPEDEEGNSECPLYLLRRIRQYDLLAELSADRFGYIAADQNIEAVVSTIFKLTSGLNLEKAGITFEQILQHNAERMGYLTSQDYNFAQSSHPADIIRIDALIAFGTAKSERALNIRMDQLTELMAEFGSSEEDLQWARFAASAGILMAKADGKMDEAERNRILEEMSMNYTTPTKILKKIEKGDVEQVFNDSMNYLEGSGYSEMMLKYLVEIAFANKEIEEEEILKLMELAARFHCSHKEVAHAVAAFLRSKDFKPVVSYFD